MCTKVKKNYLTLILLNMYATYFVYLEIFLFILCVSIPDIFIESNFPNSLLLKFYFSQMVCFSSNILPN